MVHQFALPHLHESRRLQTDEALAVSYEYVQLLEIRPPHPLLLQAETKHAAAMKRFFMYLGLACTKRARSLTTQYLPKQNKQSLPLKNRLTSTLEKPEGCAHVHDQHPTTTYMAQPSVRSSPQSARADDPVASDRTVSVLDVRARQLTVRSAGGRAS
jgi:hypothetical protein